MTAPHPKRLIEELIPLAEIGKESSKSVAYGDIHAIHTWFARRPLAACRVATFAALVNAPKTEAERDALQQLIIRGLLNTAPIQDKPAIEEMRERIRQAYDGRPPRVLDSFAGGGSLPLEAARLGCEAHALDLNPVALLTMLGTVDYPLRLAGAQIPLPPKGDDLLGLEENGLPPVESTGGQPPIDPRVHGGVGGQRRGNLVQAVEAWGRWVLERVRPELEPFYPQEDGRTVVAYFWAKTVHCTNPSCGAEIPLLAHRWLSRRKGKPPVAYRLVLHPGRTLVVEILRGPAAVDDHPERGTMARGSAQCPFCPQTISPQEVKAQCVAGRSGRMMLAVATSREGEAGTAFRPATAADRLTFERARKALAQAEANHDDPFLPLVPDEKFPPKGALGIRPSIYGIRTWGQMHNARQALALTTFTRGVHQAHAELLARGAGAEEAGAVVLYLAFTASRLAIRLSEASRWDNTRQNVQPATSGHRLPMVWDYAEANPLSGGTSSWQTGQNWALAAIKRLLGAAPEPAAVRWGDAAQLPYADDSFDAVLTDPPYYDSVPYGYLADMQYVWLHRALGDILPAYFPAPLTPKDSELIQDRVRHHSEAEAKAFFEERMKVALAEIRRVLRPEGIALVMYTHTGTSAWETMVGALIGAGLQVTASWPVNTETTARREWLGGAVLAATIFLVCRKRAGERVGYLEEILPEMREEVRRALARFWAAGIGGADFFVSAIGPALAVYSRYAGVRYSSGQAVSVANFLTLVRQAEVDFSLERALAGVDVGEVDRETQFALLWRWTYGRQRVETGAALLLDKAAGVELAELEKRGLLARMDGAKKMMLLGPQERPDLLERTLRRAQAGQASMIDTIHCACILWRDGRREELDELLAAQGDTTRKVAQALAGLQPLNGEERRLLLGLLGSWRYAAPTEAGKAKQLTLEL